jgi:hypothetical protein
MAKKIDFDKVPVNSLDIQPRGLDYDLEAINQMVRDIAKRNAEKLLEGGKVNADVEYEYKGKTYESVTTIFFDGKEIVAKGGYDQVAGFDKGEDWEPEV